MCMDELQFPYYSGERYYSNKKYRRLGISPYLYDIYDKSMTTKWLFRGCKLAIRTKDFMKLYDNSKIEVLT